MWLRVRKGDVFQVTWKYFASEEEVVYKVYRIGYGRVECVKICIKGVDSEPFPRYTYFRADKVEEGEAVIDFGYDYARHLPKLKALLYEPILDEYWKKHCNDSKSKTR